MAGAAAEASVAVEATPAVVAESTPAAIHDDEDPPTRSRPADETGRPVDARDVVSFLLEREHLAAAFELFQDVVESTSGWHGAPAERENLADAEEALEEARDTLETYFGDQERFPDRDLRAYATQVDVPLLQASVREQESRARVAEYDAELAAEDLQRAQLELEAAELERQAAEKRRASIAGNKETRGEDGNLAAVVTSSAKMFEDPDSAAPVTTTPSEDLASEPNLKPLPPPSDSERRFLNALVFDYLDRRGYRAARLTLRDEARDGDAAISIRNRRAETGDGDELPIAADGLRRAVHRASRLDARDAAHDELRAQTIIKSERIDFLERALAEAESLTSSLRDGVARVEARASETEKKRDALESRLEEAELKVALLETARAELARDFERADAAAKHLERDLLGKTREFKRALAEERDKFRAGDVSVRDDFDLSTPTKTERLTPERTSRMLLSPGASPPVHAFEASAEEEATVRALADALPKIASATLVAKRHELLPLFARAATRHRVASVRVETLRHVFDLVKRPERFHRDALKAITFTIARDAGEKRAIHELLPVLRRELAHKKQERRVAACHCVASVARALPETTRVSNTFPLLHDAFRGNAGFDEKDAEKTTTTTSVAEKAYTNTEKEDASLTAAACSETKRASLIAFAEICDCSSECGIDAASASFAESFVASALADNSEHVSECAAEVAAPAMTRWRVRAVSREDAEARGSSPVAFLESFAKGHVCKRVAEALATRGTESATGTVQETVVLDADRFRARFYLRLFARTLETFRDEAERKKNAALEDETFAEPVKRWFDANASELVYMLVHSVPKDDDDATLRRDAARATKALCVAAGEEIARDVIVPALTHATNADQSTATPVALAAALPHCGPKALEAFLREYVEREASGINTSQDVDETDARISTADRAVRRAVSLCSERDAVSEREHMLASLDDPPADVVPDAGAAVRDAITRVLEAVAGETARAREEGADGDRDRDPPAAALLATTLLGSAAAAGPAAAAARVLPALSRLAAGPEAVAARAAAALVRVGDAHAEDADADAGSEEGVAAEALRRLDDALARRNARVSSAFAAAVRDAATSRRRDKRGARDAFLSYGGGFSGSSGSSSSRAFWDGVASRVAAVTVAAFGVDDVEEIPTNDVATRRRLASLCFGAARGILEAEDDERARARSATASSMANDEPHGANANTAGVSSAVDAMASPRRDALVPALRALVSYRAETDSRAGKETAKIPLLDASDGALAEAMLRDEDWRLVAAAEAAAIVARERAAADARPNPATTKGKKSYAPSVSVPSASEMRRVMFGVKKTSLPASEPTRVVNTTSEQASSASSISTEYLVANEDEDPSSPAAPSIDFATLVGEAAPVSSIATSDAAIEKTPPEETVVAPEMHAGKKESDQKLPVKATSISSKMFSAMPSAPKMAKMPSMPKNPFL